MNKFNSNQDNHLLHLADLLENEEITLKDIYLENLLVDTLEEQAGNFEDVEQDPDFYIETDLEELPVANFALTEKIMAAVSKAAIEKTQEVHEVEEVPVFEPVTTPVGQGIVTKLGDLARGFAQPNYSNAFASEKLTDSQEPQASAEKPSTGDAITKDHSIFNLQNLILAVFAFVATIVAMSYFNSQKAPSLDIANNQAQQQQQHQVQPNQVNQQTMVAQQAAAPAAANAEFQPKPLNEGLTYVSLNIATQNANEQKLTNEQSTNLKILLINYELQKRLIGNKNN